MTVAGLDYSTKAIDIVLLADDSDDATWHRIPLAHGNGHLALARSVRALPTRSWWEEHGVWLVGIEDPMSRFPHVAKALGVVAGAIGALLPLDLAVIPTEPQEWQRIFTGLPKLPVKSADRKAAVKAAAHVREQYLHDDTRADAPQDAYDAYGIAWAVRKLNDDAIRKRPAA